MANKPTYEFPLKQDTYAAFDAISLRNLIIQRLNDQGTFTDQNFIGSNLACIIDIISYSFNTLMYYLNKTSSESMFTEAQLYENITRIVKLLDYKPVGYQTSTLAFSCSANSAFLRGVYTIPRYSYLVAGGIPFSFNEDVTFSVSSDNTILELSDLTNKKLLYQGIFRENPIYTASGNDDEVITVNITDAYIDHYNIHVYVYEKKAQTPKWVQYVSVPNLYSETANSRAFEKRLASNGSYEITFGNNINGRKLEAGDRVAVYFLQSAGDSGVVGSGTLRLINTAAVYNTTTFTTEILPNVNEEQYTYLTSTELQNIIFDNEAGSTLPKDIEDADSIRKNAPANFKSQYRLVTTTDFETFIKTNFANFVSDVRVFSNWEYTGEYLKYFYEIGLNPGGFQQIILNQVLFADACNFNNVYVCGIPRVSQGSSLKYLLPAQKEIIASNIEPLKILTSEITFMDPIYKALDFGAKNNIGVTISDTELHVLEIFKKKSNQRTNRSIQQEIATVFKDFFNPTNMKLGNVLDYALLTSKILSVDGVTRIVTRNSDSSLVYEGLSFYLWNPVYPDLDKQAIVNNVLLKSFELLYFNNLSSIESKIIITEM